MYRGYNSLWWKAFFIFAITLLGPGCALKGYRTYLNSLENLPVRNEITDVPFYAQESYQCGPAALAMVLNWSGSKVNPREITSEVYTPARKGSLQPLLISATRYHGRLPYVIRDFQSLLLEITEGHPVIVLQNLGLSWYPKWHYAVVIGYDTEKEILILHSGEVFRKKISLSLFLRTWERAEKWGLVVLPLTKLPASADESNYLGAVIAMEDLDYLKEASIAYETALKRWPKSLRALMGLGNCRYAMGDLEEAELAFHRAIDLCPTCGDAFNNLANVLAEQRRFNAAMDAAHEAVRLGGSNEAIYHETLEEIIRLKENNNRNILP